MHFKSSQMRGGLGLENPISNLFRSASVRLTQQPYVAGGGVKKKKTLLVTHTNYTAVHRATT